MSNSLETTWKASWIRKTRRARIPLAARARLKERESSWAMSAAKLETATGAAQRLDGDSSYTLF
ncbi:hypothetical protein [Methylacidimicrobium tartarophylax]|uniref:Uncharacterized protein n=1 Tax=Methylacidimicrobium tartarophylax TaxID=1041768 RepID=A0A5E6ME18_9BACT|nr:hypothetical protein [Methylacidimicrobium tartarophylax]VVM06501.1 hypothetical protein MAMT_01242 [Methylacidimicrobium tartarophylax]